MARGTHGRQGPPPDPNALRRDRATDAAGWVTLPAEGRSGPAPDWPLAGCTDREAVLWSVEWRRPQAVEWERNGQEVEVAIYVRTLVAAEDVEATAAMRVLLRQQMEALGISVPGMARNRWKIGTVTPAATGTQAATGTDGRSVRDRMKVIHGGG